VIKNGIGIAGYECIVCDTGMVMGSANDIQYTKNKFCQEQEKLAKSYHFMTI
jgi:hypothetical protein